MKKANEDIRKKIADAGVRFWQVASELGIRDNEFSRRLRHELTKEEKLKISNIINTLKMG